MGGSLAVIGTFYQRHENTPLIAAALRAQTRRPDELWLIGEGDDDVAVMREQDWGCDARFVILPTPRDGNGRYAVIPYSHKINHALDRTSAEYVVYLDNGSLPAPRKYEAMAAALDSDPTIGAVYCGQHRTGVVDSFSHADRMVEDAYCVLNYTQVMHRRTVDRWTLEMRHADPDLADALFWRSLHATLGPFHPVAGGVLDEHHIADYKAAGL